MNLEKQKAVITVKGSFDQLCELEDHLKERFQDLEEIKFKFKKSKSTMGKCDVRDICFTYHTVYGLDVIAPALCHTDQWSKCTTRETIKNDPDFIKKMRDIEDDNKRQSALLHNYPENGENPYHTLMKIAGIDPHDLS